MNCGGGYFIIGINQGYGINTINHNFIIINKYINKLKIDEFLGY